MCFWPYYIFCVFVCEKHSTKVLWTKVIQQSLTIHMFSFSLFFFSLISHFPSSSSCSCQIWRWALLSVQQIKKRWKKNPLNTKNICFAFRQTLYFFWLLTQHHAEKYFKMFGCERRAVHTVICLHISAHSSFRVRNPRQNYVIELINCFDLVSEDGIHITKATN